MHIDEFIKDIPNISYVYLKTDAAVAKMRVDKRARAGENIPPSQYTRDPDAQLRRVPQRP